MTDIYSFNGVTGNKSLSEDVCEMLRHPWYNPFHFTGHGLTEDTTYRNYTQRHPSNIQRLWNPRTQEIMLIRVVSPSRSLLALSLLKKTLLISGRPGKNPSMAFHFLPVLSLDKWPLYTVPDVQNVSKYMILWNLLDYKTHIMPRLCSFTLIISGLPESVHGTKLVIDIEPCKSNGSPSVHHAWPQSR